MNDIQRLIEYDQRLPKLVLVIGDIMEDIYIHGHLEDNCQEECQKFIEEERVAVPGGAANTARSLANWCTRVLLFGPTKARSVKTRFIVRGREQCTFRHDNDRIDPDLPTARGEAMRALTGPRRPDVVLLSDYDKGTMTPWFIEEVVDTCMAYGIPCVADCKRAPAVYMGCILKCNMLYAQQYANDLVFGDRDMNTVVVTKGSQYPNTYGQSWAEEVKLPPVKCINHVGAGDCFAAHLALALAHKFSLRDAAAIAHSAGRVYVQHPHNLPPRLEEIAEDMESGIIPASALARVEHSVAPRS